MQKRLILLLFVVFAKSILAQQTWQKATHKADSLEVNFKFSKALQFRETALKLAKNTAKDTAKDTIPFLKELLNNAVLENEIRHSKNRKKTYEKLKKSVDNLVNLHAKPKRLFQSYRRLYMFAHNYMRNMEESKVYTDKSIAEHFKCKKIDSLVLLKTMHGSGVVARVLGEFTNAIKTFDKAKAFYEATKVKDTNMLGCIYVDLAMTYEGRCVNIYKKRISYLKKAEKTFLSTSRPNMDYFVALYPMLSECEKMQGNYDNAIKYLNKGFDLYKVNKKETQSFRMGKVGFKKVLQFHLYLAQIYEITKNKEKMLMHYNKMYQIIKGKKIDVVETNFLSYANLVLSRYYRKAKKYDIANNYIKKGLVLNKKNQAENYEENLEPSFLLEKIKIALKENKFNKTKKLLLQLNNAKNKATDDITNELNINCVFNILKNDKTGTFNYLNKTINNISNSNKKIRIQTIDYDLYETSFAIENANLLLKLAEKLDKSKLNEPKITKTLYWLALKEFKENFKGVVLNEKLNKIFANINRYFFDLMVEDKLSPKEIKRFLGFTEIVQSSFIFKNFIDNKTKFLNPKLDSLINKEQFIRAKITFLKKKLIRHKKDSTKITQNIFEKTRALKRILEKQKTVDNGYLELLNQKKFNANLALFKNTPIIKFQLADSILYRIVYFKNNVTVQKIAHFNAIKNNVKAYILSLKDTKQSVTDIKQKGAALYNDLLGDFTTKATSLYIIPDDILHYLPFELLVKDGHYLIEDTAISYATTISLLSNPFEEKNTSNKIALFAPSYSNYELEKDQLAVRGAPYKLEGALAEVNQIAKIFKTKKFTKNAATKAAFKNLKEQYAVVHLSMHSFLNDEDAELSNLVFSDSDKDNILYISELYGIPINADLVVLSACNTGVGSYKTGKGVVSLNTAFTASGVPSVLSSLWSAPDKATKQLMVSFYKNLKQGDTKAIALQKAKVDYLKNAADTNLKHPYFWAGFVLSGDTSAITSPSNNFIWYLTAIALIVLLAFSYKRKKSI